MNAPPENENPEGAGGADRVECLFGKINTDDHNGSPADSLAVRKIAARYRLTLTVASVVCDLAGIGRAA